MKNKFVLVMAGLLASALTAQAQTSTATATTNTSTSKIEDLKKPDEKAKDIDEEITDARMRATLGSKSKWSFKSSLSYSGGSMNEPFSAVRPNYRAAADIEAMSYLSGDVGVNYRLGDRDSLNLGTGIMIMDPLHGDLTKPAEDSRKGRSGTLPRYEVSSPFLSWSRGYRALNTQMISSVTYSHATDSDSVNLRKQFGSIGLSQTILANFGQSAWSGGTSLNFYQYFYTGDVTDPGLVAAMDAGKVKRTEQSFGAFPFLQYAFNDRYSFRTVFGYFQFARYADYSGTYQQEPYQSIGAGISVTRDIYLYPNLQFTPKDIRSDRTNVALSANISLF